MKSIMICPQQIFGQSNQWEWDGGGGGKSTGENINAYKVLMGKPEGKRPVARTRRGWKYIKIDIKELRL